MIQNIKYEEICESDTEMARVTTKCGPQYLRTLLMTFDQVSENFTIGFVKLSSSEKTSFGCRLCIVVLLCVMLRYIS